MEVTRDGTGLQAESTVAGLLLDKSPEGVPQAELSGRREGAEHTGGCVFFPDVPTSLHWLPWGDFLLNVTCYLLSFDLHISACLQTSPGGDGDGVTGQPYRR